jgi:hypothetical protein
MVKAPRVVFPFQARSQYVETRNNTSAAVHQCEVAACQGGCDKIFALGGLDRRGPSFSANRIRDRGWKNAITPTN